MLSVLSGSPRLKSSVALCVMPECFWDNYNNKVMFCFSSLKISLLFRL